MVSLCGDDSDIGAQRPDIDVHSALSRLGNLLNTNQGQDRSGPAIACNRTQKDPHLVRSLALALELLLSLPVPSGPASGSLIGTVHTLSLSSALHLRVNKRHERTTYENTF